MILKFEIIIYCGTPSITLPTDGQLFSKDFVKKDHDNNQGAIEVSGTFELRDDLTTQRQDCRSFESTNFVKPYENGTWAC
jgi:hypothetical protein